MDGIVWLALFFFDLAVCLNIVKELLYSSFDHFWPDL